MSNINATSYVPEIQPTHFEPLFDRGKCGQLLSIRLRDTKLKRDCYNRIFEVSVISNSKIWNSQRLMMMSTAWSRKTSRKRGERKIESCSYYYWLLRPENGMLGALMLPLVVSRGKRMVAALGLKRRTIVKLRLRLSKKVMFGLARLQLPSSSSSGMHFIFRP